MEADQQLESSIKEIVTKHYQDNSSPLLLSFLGKTLRDAGAINESLLRGRTLSQVVESVDDLLLLRDMTSPAYVAVATTSSRQVVEAHIKQRSESRKPKPRLQTLPRSLLLAFCVKTNPGERVFVQKTPPFRYQVATSPDEVTIEEFAEVESRYRRPGLWLSNEGEVNTSDRVDLESKIESWSRDKGISFDEIAKPPRRPTTSALERLLAAQPPGVAKRMLIPADIALLLSREE